MNHASETITSAAPASNGRILVVDDDGSCRLFMAAMLEKRGFVVSAAEGFQDAMAKFQAAGLHGFDCVVTDYLMPDGNGIDLLHWLRKKDSAIATIVVTMEREKSLVAQSLRYGACDFLDKPTKAAELAAAAGRAIALTRHRRRLEQSQEAVNRIGRLQQLMLRNVPGGALKIELCFFPKHEAGGDSLTRFVLDSHRHLVLLTDVAGHDINAAFVSAYFQGFVRGMIERITPVSTVFEAFDILLEREWNSEKAHGAPGGLLTSVAATALLIDLNEKTAIILGCGAPIPVHVTAQGRPVFCGSIGGSPLGWSAAADIRTTSRPIDQGEAFLMWSDGLESFAEQHEVQPLTLAAVLLLANIGVRIPLDIGGALDDILVTRVCLPGNSDASGLIPLLKEDYTAAQASQIDALQRHWSDTLLFCFPDLEEPKLFNVLLASREAVLNAFRHGCRNSVNNLAQYAISYHPSSRTLRVFVDDPGSGYQFDVNAYETAAVEHLIDAHRGLILIEHLVDRWTVERNGASLIMDFFLDIRTNPR